MDPESTTPELAEGLRHYQKPEKRKKLKLINNNPKHKQNKT